jgi:hypothetical protein
MELLIRVNHKQPVGSELHDTASQAGDVIAAVENGWPWSNAERKNPDWIIVHCELTQSEVEALLEPARMNETPWRRRLGINPDMLKSGDVLTRAQLMARLF